MRETIASQVYGNVIGGMADHLKGYWDAWTPDKKLLPRMNSVVFEVGSGNGQVCRYLRDEVCCHVVGSEVCRDGLVGLEEMTNEAIFLDIAEDKIQYEDNEFDFVMCFEVLEHIINPYHALKEMKRICKDNGYIHISIPDGEQQVGYDSHQHAFVYPGLFEHKNFKTFLMQMYMKIEFEMQFTHATTFTVEEDKNINYKKQTAAKHHYFICKNLATDVDIVKVINGDYQVKELYSFMNEEEHNE
jgi:ubiquinone/menaquinone biosynthesis C-methylase UbiE